MSPLNLDTSRCNGRNLRTDYFCPERETCMRYRTVAIDVVPNYRGIPFASIMRADGDAECHFKIRVIEETE